MVITACAHPQTDDARGLVFEPCEPTIASYLIRKEGGTYGSGHVSRGDGLWMGRPGDLACNQGGMAMNMGYASSVVIIVKP